MKTLVVVIAALVACGKSDKPAPSGAPESKAAAPTPTETGSAAAAPAAGSGSGAGSASGSGATCAQPCTLLKDTPLADVRAQCADWAVGKEGDEGCEAADHARNCIYASYGYTFKKDRWKKAFGSEPWYKPDPAFKNTAMSPTAIANVAALKKLGAACKAAKGEPSPKTTKALDAWFAARKKGTPPLPEKVTDLDAQPSTKDAFTKNFLGKDSTLFFKDPWESYNLVWKNGEIERVTVSTGIPDPTTCTSDDEGCEGFEWLTFTVENGTITAIEAGAAACPFVYERVGDTWAYRGEILRNLATRAIEGTQALALVGGCTATRTVRVTEEKRERTYLDSVVLSIDGRTIRPDACSTVSAMCADDGIYLELGEGDAIELTFTLPTPSCSAGELVANGYYTPLR